MRKFMLMSPDPEAAGGGEGGVVNQVVVDEFATLEKDDVIKMFKAEKESRAKLESDLAKEKEEKALTLEQLKAEGDWKRYAELQDKQHQDIVSPLSEKLKTLEAEKNLRDTEVGQEKAWQEIKKELQSSFADEGMSREYLLSKYAKELTPVKGNIHPQAIKEVVKTIREKHPTLLSKDTKGMDAHGQAAKGKPEDLSGKSFKERMELAKSQSSSFPSMMSKGKK